MLVCVYACVCGWVCVEVEVVSVCVRVNLISSSKCPVCCQSMVHEVEEGKVWQSDLSRLGCLAGLEVTRAFGPLKTMWIPGFWTSGRAGGLRFFEALQTLAFSFCSSTS